MFEARPSITSMRGMPDAPTTLSSAAYARLRRDILQGELYVLGAGVIQTTFLAAQVAGAVGGGIAVAFVGTRPALVWGA